MSDVDVNDLKFVTIERPDTFSITGAAFFEGEESVKQNKSLYVDMPLLNVALHEQGNIIAKLT